MTSSRRYLAVTTTALSCALLVSGCGYLTGGLDPDNEPLTDSRVVGTWEGTTCQASLTLAADHTAHITGLPVAADASKVTKTLNGDGTWTVSADRLSLIIGTSGHEVLSGKDGSTTVLYATAGDPDLGVACRYVRRDDYGTSTPEPNTSRPSSILAS
ncbi:hypothetical protein [Streptomyces sp. NPDC096033]|uniref:hypothetical protein n=1 Tax=Streptomyces sp. NPDC096033 TaxID=3366071 RepID=UPI003817CE18